jgi:hypothetical protein
MTARATTTLPTEDPLPTTPIKKGGNESAYQGDFDTMREALRVATVK